MKKFIYLFAFCSLVLFSYTLPGEESIYDGSKISYNVEKGRGVVMINLGLKNPQDFEEITVLRSDNPAKFFRNVKYLNPEQVAELGNDNLLIDKYPLPGSVTSYYKVQTIDKYGVQKTYPSVKLILK